MSGSETTFSLVWVARYRPMAAGTRPRLFSFAVFRSLSKPTAAPVGTTSADRQVPRAHNSNNSNNNKRRRTTTKRDEVEKKNDPSRRQDQRPEMGNLEKRVPASHTAGMTVRCSTTHSCGRTTEKDKNNPKKRAGVRSDAEERTTGADDSRSRSLERVFFSSTNKRRPA